VRTHSWYMNVLAMGTAAVLTYGSVEIVNARPQRIHAAAGKPLIIDVNTGQDTLDPSATVQLGPASNINILYARLTKLGTKPGPFGTQQVDPRKIEPWLAKSWKISNKNTTYTFYLRAGARFSNGDPLNAAAVKYTFNRNLKMGTGGNYFEQDGIIGNIRSVTAKGQSVVIIKLRHPDPNILQAWWTPSMGIVDPKVVQAHGGVSAGKTNQWVAQHGGGFSGPYIISSYQPDARITFRPNPRYFGPKPASSEIVENVIHSDATMLLRARSNGVDATVGLSPQAVNSLKADKNLRIIANPTTNMEELAFNNKVAPLDNVAFRKALAYAIPYTQIIKKLTYGYGQPFCGPLPPVMPFYNHSLYCPYHFSLAKARALLAKSKVSLPVTLNVTIEEGNAVEEQISTIAQGIWGTLGVKLTINRLAPSDYTSSLFAKKTQVFMREDGPGVIDPGYFLGYDITGCKDPNFSLSNVCIPKAESLLAQARFTTNAKKRQRLFNQISRLWIGELPKINLYALKGVTVVNRHVNGFVYSIFGNYQDWSVR